MDIKINILYEFKDSAWGGANQFLKALRDYFIKQDSYTEKPEHADVILFNSYPFGKPELFEYIKSLKKGAKNPVIIHRVDGPTVLIRGRDFEIDKVIFVFNQSAADATIFQSGWSKAKCFELGMPRNDFETTIINAPDSNIFYPAEEKEQADKVRIIATSWSPNMSKGFDIYKHLDENLDFSRYDMTFVGNTPVEFKNINHIEPKPSNELGGLLREHDLYITGSINDPCSNSLIEALHCGLPAVVRNSGGHPEITGEGGMIYNGVEDVISVIDKAASDIDTLKSKITIPDMNETGEKYLNFCREVSEKTANAAKKFGFWKHFKLMRQVKQVKP